MKATGLIKHTTDIDKITRDDYIVFSFEPPNGDSIRSISKPFDFMPNIQCETSDIDCLSNEFNQVLI